MILTLAMALPALLLQATPTAAESDTPQQASASASGTASTEAEKAESGQLAEASTVSDKNHPDYVRCRSERVIGSLAKRKKTCKTNREWEEVARVGNRGARDIVESQQVGMNGQ